MLAFRIAGGYAERVTVAAAAVFAKPPALDHRFPRAERDGIQAIRSMMPKSAAFRDEVRTRLVAMAGSGRLVVPVARTFPLDAAPEALALLQGGHPGGKLALVP